MFKSIFAEVVNTQISVFTINFDQSIMGIKSQISKIKGL